MASQVACAARGTGSAPPVIVNNKASLQSRSSDALANLDRFLRAERVALTSRKWVPNPHAPPAGKETRPKRTPNASKRACVDIRGEAEGLHNEAGRCTLDDLWAAKLWHFIRARVRYSFLVLSVHQQGGVWARCAGPFQVAANRTFTFRQRAVQPYVRQVE